VVQDPELAVHLVLTVSALCDVVALFLLLRLARELDIGPVVSTCVAVLYAISPLLLSLSGPLNGLETALNLAVTFAFLMLYRRTSINTSQTFTSTVNFGVCSGLLFLARTDNVILLVFAHAFLLLRQRSVRSQSKHRIVSILVASAVAAPWLTWSWTRFGSPVQVSGLSVARFMRDLVNAQGWTMVGYGMKVLRNLGTVATYFPVYHPNSNSFVAASAGNLVIVLALAGGLMLRYRTDTPENRRAFSSRLGPWVPPLLACAVLVFLHTLRGIELRGWYYASMLPVLYVVLGITGDYVVSRLTMGPGRARPYLLAAGTGFLAVVLILSLRAELSRRCGEIDSYKMIRAMNKALPDGVLLGSWNAGLFGYFYERGNVVNLDGLVNNSAYDNMMSRSVGNYVSRRKITYLLDAGGAMELWRPYWNRTNDVAFPNPILDNAAIAECREIRLVRTPQSRISTGQ
jgi:4-amino-4-deoxy-L-arabinose transferase-like glycosyltransferase